MRLPIKRNDNECTNSIKKRSSVFLELSPHSDIPIKIFFLSIYVSSALFILFEKRNLSTYDSSTNPLYYAIGKLVQSIMEMYLTTGGISLCILLVLPLSKFITQYHLRSIGLTNRVGIVPMLMKRYRDPKNTGLTIWEFSSRGIPLDVWEDKKAAIETVLDITITKMKYGNGKSRILVYSVPAKSDLPAFVNWDDRLLPQKTFVLTLGESFTGPVYVDLSKVPHILLGGSTGSGKSVLLKLLLMQAVQKGANVCISDFKGGVDFPLTWHQKCRMSFDEDETLDLLTELVDELQNRKTLLADSGHPNIDQFNQETSKKLQRYIFACDEIAEMLDKTGLTKEQKEIVSKIESKLSIIARLGRAFGIHLILATQRPDANIISGQIKNNINYRICGRADNVLSQIILDCTDAAEMIPEDAQGRFILQDGTIFQAYWFDDTGGG